VSPPCSASRYEASRASESAAQPRGITKPVCLINGARARQTGIDKRPDAIVTLGGFEDDDNVDDDNVDDDNDKREAPSRAHRTHNSCAQRNP
jgi:hypothetical protein